MSIPLIVLSVIVIALFAFAVYLRTRKWGVNYYTFYLAKAGSIKNGLVLIVFIAIALTILGFILGCLTNNI